MQIVLQRRTGQQQTILSVQSADSLQVVSQITFININNNNIIINNIELYIELNIELYVQVILLTVENCDASFLSRCASSMMR